MTPPLIGETTERGTAFVLLSADETGSHVALERAVPCGTCGVMAMFVVHQPGGLRCSWCAGVGR